MPGSSPISMRVFSPTPARSTRAGGGFSPRSARTVRRRWPNCADRRGRSLPAASSNGAPAAALDAEALRRATSNSIRALQLIRAYRVRGHLEADLDPLGLDKRGPYPELDYRSYGFAEADLDREIFLNDVFGRERASLRQIIAMLRADLLRHDRRRIHAHPGAGRARLDPAEIRDARSAVRRCRRPTARKSLRS